MSDDWRLLRLRRDGTCAECGVALVAGVPALWSSTAAAVRCPSHAGDAPAPLSADGDGDAWSDLTLRRPAMCGHCGAELAVGTSARWNRARRVARCLTHETTAATPADATPVPRAAAARVTGTAGASAQAEYERRRARREQQVRDAHPIVGGLILALSDEPHHVTAWRQGAAGERAVARRLDQMVGRGVEVLHDRRIPGTKANIDHIAVSSSGVYVIDAKNYAGTVRVDRQGGLLGPRRYRLLVGRRDATKLVAGVQRQVQAVRDVLAGDPRLPDDVSVNGVLAFFHANWPLFPPGRIDDVHLEGPRSTGKLISRDGPYTQQVVADITDRLHDRLPPA